MRSWITRRTDEETWWGRVVLETRSLSERRPRVARVRSRSPLGGCRVRSLKGFEQWFSWRSRSDRANLITLLHFLAARHVGFEAPAAYDARPVAVLDDTAREGVDCGAW